MGCQSQADARRGVGLAGRTPGTYNRAMAPPLLTLSDIHLTFGGTPLMTGVGPVEAAVAAVG